jgi:hypothetical protein
VHDSRKLTHLDGFHRVIVVAGRSDIGSWCCSHVHFGVGSGASLRPGMAAVAMTRGLLLALHSKLNPGFVNLKTEPEK